MKLLTLSTRTINNGRGNGRKGVGGGEETEECQQLMKKCAAFFNQSSLPREFMGEKSVLKENVKGAILGIYRLFIFPFFNKLKKVLWSSECRQISERPIRWAGVPHGPTRPQEAGTRFTSGFTDDH